MTAKHELSVEDIQPTANYASTIPINHQTPNMSTSVFGYHPAPLYDAGDSMLKYTSKYSKK
jgi:hypothetical protein